VQSLSDLIFDEIRSGNISERQSRQRATRFSAHLVIARPADAQVALFELIGERKYLAKLVPSHGEESF
jgi:hypothetical protein